MDIYGTDGDDKLTHTLANREGWNTYFGKKGHDQYYLYQGTVLGGQGNDRIERIPIPGESWHVVQAAYWDSPAGVTVDLAAGTAYDGWGTIDTLVGVTEVAGSWHNDVLRGTTGSNTFYVGGGKTTLDGRGGDDLVWLPAFNPNMDISEFKIIVAIDGLSAAISWSGRAEFSVALNNVARIGVGYKVDYSIGDFIKPEDLALKGLIAADANRWNVGAELGTGTEVTFSFVTSAPASGAGASGFQAFNEAQRVVVRAILDSAAQVSGLSFREVASGGQMTFGASQQSGTKGVATMPGQPGGGQVWMDIESITSLAPGSEGYGALLHEIGHALGLRHTRNGAGDNYALQWRPEDDSTARSVMSDALSFDGLFQSGWGAYDVLALRHLYGSKAAAVGDTHYLLNGLRFSAQSAIVDDGGIDTIDASAASAGAAIDLAPGKVSSVGVTATGLAAVDNLAIAPGSWIENATGSDYDDVIKGNALDNLLRGGKGNDWLEGGGGIDTAAFAGLRSDYLLSTGFGKVFLSARDGISGFDTLVGIEKISFANGESIVLAGAALSEDAEIAVDQNASIGGVLPAASDAAGATYQIVSGPAHGALTLTAAGAYVYTPVTGFHSEDVFSYQISAANGVSNLYKGYVAVRQINPTIAGSAGADQLAGGAGNDLIDASSGDDRVAGSAGNDGISGGAGMDWVSYQGKRSEFAFAAVVKGVSTVAKAGGGSDTLDGIERVQFADGSAVALDVDGAAGQTYRVYQAAFDRKPDAAGLGYWLFNMDRGTSLEDVAGAFMESQEFRDLYGAAPTADQFVSRLYQNVLHRAPEQAGYDFWVAIVAGGYSRAAVLAAFAESAENQDQVAAAIGLGIDYLPFG